MEVKSKLPQVGTTIFTVMTQRANECGAINLSQGFPNYDPPDRLKALLAERVAKGDNQYAPMTGVPALREEIARKFARSYGVNIDPESEITITLGATEGIFSAIQALVHPGDEVIVFDPSYDSYAPAVALAGGKSVHIALRPPRFAIDWAEVDAAISPRTRMIIVNSPHNPATSVLTSDDAAQLARVVRNRSIFVLSDEVYEHMVFDGRKHCCLCAQDSLRERTVSVFSFGKTLHATGWRVGYTIAPPDITREIRRVHQFNTFSIAAPMQHAIAEFLREAPEHNASLAGFYQAKRDFFLARLQGSRFKFAPAAGTYFQLLDYSAISNQSDVEFADALIRDAGVASIPLSPFYISAPPLRVLRFCFAKQEATLEEAARRLSKL